MQAKIEMIMEKEFQFSTWLKRLLTWPVNEDILWHQMLRYCSLPPFLSFSLLGCVLYIRREYQDRTDTLADFLSCIQFCITFIYWDFYVYSFPHCLSHFLSLIPSLIYENNNNNNDRKLYSTHANKHENLSLKLNHPSLPINFIMQHLIMIFSTRLIYLILIYVYCMYFPLQN